MINLKALFVLLNPKDKSYDVILILECPTNDMLILLSLYITLSFFRMGFIIEECK